MRGALGGALVAVLFCAATALGEDLGVLVKVGLRDESPTEWQGKVEVVGGAFTDLRGWRLHGGDALEQTGTFKLTTDEVPGAKKPQTYAKGLLATVQAGPGTRLRLAAGDLTWDVAPADLPFGLPLVHDSGALSVQLAPRYATLSATDREDDYPAVCALPDGRLIAVWQSYASKEDRLYWSTYRDGRWADGVEVPGFAGDLYRPACAPDGKQGFWVLCPRQDRGDFDLYALHYDGARWSGPTDISGARGNDFNQALATDADGVVYCAWQAFRGGSSDILLSRCIEGTWQKPVPVAASPANEWQPALCAGPSGVWVAWDTYQNGSYDVYAARLVDGEPEPALPIAASPRFEAKASLASDPSGRVFIAWQDAGEDWGKDTGYTVPQEQRRQPIYRERAIKVACLEGDRFFGGPDVAASMPPGERGFVEEPRLCCDRSGRLWLVFRHPVSLRTPRGNRVWTERGWENYATCLDGGAWTPAMYFPDRMARIDTFAALAPLDSGVAVVFHTDGRDYPRIRDLGRNRVFATTLTVAQAPPEPVLTEAQRPSPAVVREDEARDLRRARTSTVDIGGRRLRLLRGDTHRHTEISWDGNGDGSVLDAYRYAMDAAALDFFMVSDHNQQTGVDLEYVWWRSYKLADVFDNPPVFNTLYGYERSVGFPQGHRNVVRAQRDYPSFPHTGRDDDLKLLYDYCRREGAIVIAHTTGSNHGTNWPYFDPVLEPVIEIFQGCRTSYEYEGAPKSATPGDPQADSTGYQPEGFLWRAWQRDLRLGIISSSDHGSTHYSYAGVYCEEPSRDGVLQGLLRRHTFGATDNIVVKMTCGDHLMGDAWKQAEAPVLDIEVLGTAPISQLSIVRDFEFVYTDKPDKPDVKLRWMDNDFTPGTHLYYLRAQQADEALAWGSPVWVTKG